MTQWGPPDRSYPLSNGGTVLEYYKTRNVQTGGYTVKTPQTTHHQGVTPYGMYSGTSTTYVEKEVPVRDLNFWCKTIFNIDQAGRIIAWRFEGNDCTANDPDN